MNIVHETEIALQLARELLAKAPVEPHRFLYSKMIELHKSILRISDFVNAPTGALTEIEITELPHRGDYERGELYAEPEFVSAQPEKHNHYFKNVSHLNYIDVYRLIELYDITCPVQQHILKKSLAAGKRGAKDQVRDVQDIADSANRWLQMREEDQAA
jgi:hypothetical protein